jgi:hypothetical protein
MGPPCLPHHLLANCLKVPLPCQLACRAIGYLLATFGDLLVIIWCLVVSFAATPMAGSGEEGKAVATSQVSESFVRLMKALVDTVLIAYNEKALHWIMQAAILVLRCVG